MAKKKTSKKTVTRVLPQAAAPSETVMTVINKESHELIRSVVAVDKIDMLSWVKSRATKTLQEEQTALEKKLAYSTQEMDKLRASQVDLLRETAKTAASSHSSYTAGLLLAAPSHKGLVRKVGNHDATPEHELVHQANGSRVLRVEFTVYLIKNELATTAIEEISFTEAVLVELPTRYETTERLLADMQKEHDSLADQLAIVRKKKQAIPSLEDHFRGDLVEAKVGATAEGQALLANLGQKAAELLDSLI